VADHDQAELEDYERWRALNSEPFSLHDYAYAAAFKQCLPADAIVALAAVLWPAFVEVDGLVLLAEQFSAEKLDALRSQGLPANEVEFWMNILAVDGFFQSLPGTSPSHARSLARTLRQAWQAKLALDFPHCRFKVEVVEDEDVGDVCVVFNRTATAR